jgi:uncharacterized protein YdaU (DUF1376 family)
MVNWYKRDPDRALNGMAELSLVERGAYNSLLDLLYSRNGNVPDDDVLVARMIRCHWREWKAVKKRLIAKGKIWVTADGLMGAKRVQDCLTEAASFSQEQSKRAAKGWQKRKKFNVINHPSMPLAAMPPRNASTTTTTEEESQVRGLSSSSVGVVFGTESERAPVSGGRACDVESARPPLPVAPPPQPAESQEASEARKRLTEEERAKQVAGWGIRPLKPKRMPDAPLSEPPLTRAESGRKSILALERERKHAQPGNGRERVEALESVVAASTGPGPTAPEPDVGQPEQPGIHRLDGLLRQPHEQSSAVHAGGEAIGPPGDAAEQKPAGPVNGSFYAPLNSPEQRAWEDHLGAARRDEAGGWSYPKQWPDGQAKVQGYQGT